VSLSQLKEGGTELRAVLPLTRRSADGSHCDRQVESDMEGS
jgi:hypothetical protein